LTGRAGQQLTSSKKTWSEPFGTTIAPLANNVAACIGSGTQHALHRAVGMIGQTNHDRDIQIKQSLNLARQSVDAAHTVFQINQDIVQTGTRHQGGDLHLAESRPNARQAETGRQGRAKPHTLFQNTRKAGHGITFRFD